MRPTRDCDGQISREHFISASVLSHLGGQNVKLSGVHFMHYNFVRIHQTLKITPAMAAGVTSQLWEMSDMVKVLEAWEAANKSPTVNP